jgi:hypothetical protein
MKKKEIQNEISQVVGKKRKEENEIKTELPTFRGSSKNKKK